MKKLTQTKEDYLRVLLELSQKNEYIRSVDVVCTMGLSPASVSRMMNVLKDAGYIMKQKYGMITLTENGIDVAMRMRESRNVIRTFLTDVLGVESSIAEKDACQMEHSISEETEKMLCELIAKMKE